MNDFIVLGDGFLAQAGAEMGFPFVKPGKWDGEEIKTYLPPNLPKYIVNTIAINSLDYCEKNPEKAFKINAKFPCLLSDWCEKTGRKLIHISSASVYGWTNRRCKETDLCNPGSAFALSKAAGDGLISENSLVIRPGLLFSVYVDHPRNLCDRIKLFEKVSIETTSLTCAELVFEFIKKNREKTGIFNLKTMDKSIMSIARDMGLKKPGYYGENINSRNKINPHVILDAGKSEKVYN